MTIHQRPIEPPMETSARMTAHLLDELDNPFFARFVSNCPNVFLSRPFLEAVKKHLLQQQEKLLLIGVTDEFGLPVAIFPFVHRRHLGVSLIEGVDFGIADYFAPCLAGDRRLTADETDLLWKELLRVLPPADAIAFKKMPRILYGENHALSSARFIRPMGACATTLALHHTQAIGCKGEPASLAREVRRKAKKLEKYGPLQFRAATTSEEIDEGLARLVEFRRARFAEIGRRDALLHEGIVSFYRELTLGNGGHPVGRVFTLHAGEKLIAVVYGMAYQGVFTLIIPTIAPDKEVQAGSPGLVSLFRALEWCREEGYQFFDLSVGSLHYKTRFQAETVELYEYQQALTPRGRIIVAEAALRRRMRKAALKRPWIRELANSTTRIRVRSRAKLQSFGFF